MNNTLTALTFTAVKKNSFYMRCCPLHFVCFNKKSSCCYIFHIHTVVCFYYIFSNNKNKTYITLFTAV